MSNPSIVTCEEHGRETDNTVAVYDPLDECPKYTLHFVSSMFANVQQLKTDVNVEYQHDKHDLNQLNKSMNLFVNGVQQLELQNAQYVTKLADFRRHLFHIHSFGSDLDKRYVHMQADLMALKNEKINYEFEYELYQMQIEIHRQLIDITNQSSDKEGLKLQQELDQSSTMLISLRTSYGELQKNIEGLHAEREDTFKQYLKVAKTWGCWKKQTNVLKVNLQALRNQHVFYKELRAKVGK
jgi:chromosome segregation ATPase